MDCLHLDFATRGSKGEIEEFDLPEKQSYSRPSSDSVISISTSFDDSLLVYQFIVVCLLMVFNFNCFKYIIYKKCLTIKVTIILHYKKVI